MTIDRVPQFATGMPALPAITRVDRASGITARHPAVILTPAITTSLSATLPCP